MSESSAFFHGKRQKKLARILLGGTLLLILLVALRWYLLYGTKQFDYMINYLRRDRGFAYLSVLINVGLAWIPLLITLIMTKVSRENPNKWLMGGLFLLWLCFFPNAPYLLTDVIHIDIYKYHVISKWHHWAMLFLSIFIGFFLGMLSFHELGQIGRRWIIKWAFLGFTAVVFLLSSFGVWLGRYQRWYSWDLVVQPKAFIKGVSQLLHEPSKLEHAIQFSVGLSVFMGVCQFFMDKWLGKERTKFYQ